MYSLSYSSRVVIGFSKALPANDRKDRLKCSRIELAAHNASDPASQPGVYDGTCQAKSANSLA